MRYPGYYVPASLLPSRPTSDPHSILSSSLSRLRRVNYWHVRVAALRHCTVAGCHIRSVLFLRPSQATVLRRVSVSCLRSAELLSNAEAQASAAPCRTMRRARLPLTQLGRQTTASTRRKRKGLSVSAPPPLLYPLTIPFVSDHPFPERYPSSAPTARPSVAPSVSDFFDPNLDLDASWFGAWNIRCGVL